MRVALHNRQRAVPFDHAWMESMCCGAATACLPHAGVGTAVLASLEAVEISVVSDRVIAQVHRQFLHVNGPTDVITFEHGEILVSATTARKRAVLEEESTDRELARYVVHGMLHLNGHRDENPAEAKAMWEVQELVLQAIWPKE